MEKERDHHIEVIGDLSLLNVFETLRISKWLLLNGYFHNIVIHHKSISDVGNLRVYGLKSKMAIDRKGIVIMLVTS